MDHCNWPLIFYNVFVTLRKKVAEHEFKGDIYKN